MGRFRDSPTEKELDRERQIVSVYDSYQGNASVAAENLGCSIATVIKYWRKNDLEIRPQGRHGNDSYIRFLH